MGTSIAEIDSKIQALLMTLKRQGHIDGQFEQLLLLQDESEPDFVRSVMELFFEVCIFRSTSVSRQVHKSCLIVGCHIWKTGPTLKEYCNCRLPGNNAEARAADHGGQAVLRAAHVAPNSGQDLVSMQSPLGGLAHPSLHSNARIGIKQRSDWQR
jgi:hypothetical protein